MSFKDYFDKSAAVQVLANKSAQEIGAEVESVGYHEQDIIREERFIPQVDYTLPGTFARYGLAEEYYNQSLKRIYDEYPYDGSLEERVKWENSSTYLDLHIFDEEYPRTNGYISFSPSGWGSLDGGLTADGYGLPATVEYIALKGGPHPNPDGMNPYSTQFTGSNYYETAKNRENNLQYDLQSKGVSVEFWLKKEAFDTSKTHKEVIYDLYNGGAEETDDYGRLTIELSASGPVGTGIGGLDPFIVTLFSGNVGIATASVCPDTLTTASVADNAWHHYAFTFMSASASTGVDVNFYIDGSLSKTTALTTLDPDGLRVGLNEVTGALQARLGALITSPTGSTAAASAGKLSASLDEFRYWKTERTGKDIGRYWFTQVGGGTNDDPTPYVESTETINTNLGVYYKFNEGITGVAATDSVVLDFSGRITNGSWTGYTAAGRSTGSAIVESAAAIKEFKDPIIYSFHPAVVALSTRLQISGSDYDVNNNASIYNTIPSWMVNEDIESQSEIKHLTQIISSYFDTLHLQVESLSKIQNVEYVTGSSKPYPFADRRLASQGLFAPNLFLDADVLEKLADRSEDRVYEKSLSDIKNTIYQNIYNNLVYIYKSKGTEKAFRNMIRCFGIDDELVKLNAYAGNLEYDIRDNRRIVSVAEKFIDFNTAANTQASVFQYQDPGDTVNTSGYLPGNTELTGGYAQTLEVDVLFPLKPAENSSTYVNTNTISASVFGLHGVESSESDTSWDRVSDASNFQVYAARDEITSDNARFTLTSTAGGVVPDLQSPLFEDVYNNTHWNLAVRIKPEQYPWAGAISGYSNNYIVELHGVQLDAGIIRNEFTVSGTIASPAAGFVSGSKRVYVGAHRTNFTGTVLQTSDIKVDACRYWLDYLDDETLAGHAYDTQNYGSLNPHYSAFPFVSSSMTNEVLQADTLVFNWEFSENTGSNTAGEFRVADESSGSAVIAASRFGWAGPLLATQYTSLGYDFAVSSAKAIDKDFILSSKLQLPENVQSSDMVNVLNKQDQNVFTRDSRPVNYFFAFEKSMAQAVSVEMINYFATLKDINNIIGAPVNRYRTEYKGLKILRQRFFERVSNNVIDFDKFYEFYKWFDTSLSTMIQQLIPASADFAENVRTLIESHVLERSKYQHKFQNVKQQLNTIEGVLVGSQQTGEQSQSPEDDPQGTGFYSLNAFSRRQLGSSQPIDFKSWNLDHAPVPLPAAAPGTAKSILFDGVDQYLQSSTYDVWDGLIGGAAGDALPYSVSFWVNPQTLANQRRLFCFGDNAGGAREMRIYGTTGRISTSAASSNLYATTTGNVLSVGTWAHVVVTFPGSTGSPPTIYVNASAPAAATGAGNPAAALSTSGLTIAAIPTSGTRSNFAHVYMCDFAVWDKALTPTEITEIYGTTGKRVKLSETTCASNLLSWWRMGSDPLDTYNGTIYDQVGGRNATPVNLDSDDITTESPAFVEPYSAAIPAPQNSKTIWWRSRASRGVSTISSSHGAVNTNKQVMLNSIEKGNIRAQNSIVRFGAGGNRTLGGVGSAANKKVNFVFKATEPFGPGTNVAPENVIVGLGSGVEQLINTTDEYHPAFKQRLGFDMDPNANRGNADSDSFDGNIIAPFSIYSSSLDSGANVLSDTYATGTIITNLHHDFVYDSDIPAQGPFTEQFVGGRQFRHTPINESGSNGVDQASNRAEGWKIESTGISSSATTEYTAPMLGIVPPNYDGTKATFYDADIPTAHRLRNVGTKRPVNIQNIKMTTSSIGNYQKNYQVVQSNSRRKNDPYFNDQSFDFALYPETLATRGRFPLSIESTANPGGALNYALPERTGSNSNQTIIVNRFAGSGYEVMSRGYMGPAHEEMSVYNALPYHNLSILDHGLSGSASVDPLAAKTITVVDQISKNRGLDQRATLHSGRFGSDAAYGSVVASTYVTVPSWHKTNRNPRTRMQNDLSLAPGVMPAESSYTASVYDNLYVQHQIPQSEQQYSWIAGAMAEGEVIYGLDAPACISSSTLSSFAPFGPVGSVYLGIGGANRVWGQDIRTGIYATHASYSASVIHLDYVGLNTIIAEPVSASSHILGYPQQNVTPQYAGAPFSAWAFIRSTYINQDIQSGYLGAGVFGPQVGVTDDWGYGTVSINAVLNSILLNRNGPYGWPTWKQIRAGQGPVGRALRKQNLIGQIVPPPTFQTTTGLVQGLKANTFVDYIEQPIASNGKPVFFAFEDNDSNPDVANNLAMNVSYQNNLDYFSNEGLNNRLGVNQRRLVNVGTAFNAVVDFTLTASLSTVIRYGERIYPAKTNVYQTRTRTRTEYSISDIWNDVRTLRSVGAYNSQGDFIPNASIWPLDPYSGQENTIEFNGESEGTAWANSVAGNGAGELQSGNTRFSSSIGLTSISASAQYIMPFFAGTTSGETVMANSQPWHAIESSSNGPPYQPYVNYAEKIRLIGKDMSIVPEFRISEHIIEYIDDNNGNYLAKLDNMFTLTGSAASSSAQSNFYKLYSTTDFMKYFKVVDDDLADKTNGNSQPIRRHSIELSCDALLQFLPYKGFYPAERTVQLTSLLSRSLGNVRHGILKQVHRMRDTEAARRILYEPLVSPGILYNTIKSGIAVSSVVICGTASANQNIENMLYSGSPEFDVPLAQGSGIGAVQTSTLDTPSYIKKTELDNRMMVIGDSGSVYHASSGLYGQTIPFEAIRNPEAYLSVTAIDSTLPGPTPASAHSGTLLWDTGTREAYLGHSTFQGGPVSTCISYDGSTAKSFYKLGIDNFLCETVNFFQTPLKSFVSKPEEEFLAVTKEQYYGMQVKLAIPTSASTSDYGKNILNSMMAAATGEVTGFGMYGQETAFGPLACITGSYPAATPALAKEHPIGTCEPWLPPYWYGYANVNILFKAPWTGKVSLDDILGTAVYEYDKVSADRQQPGIYHLDYRTGTDVQRPQITASVNIDTKLLVVPPDTNTQQARWLIQSKFETPVLNFFMTPSTRVVTGSSDSLYVSNTTEGVNELPEPRGMWHQKGNTLEDGVGIMLSLTELPPNYTSKTYGNIQLNSLSKIVGFQTDQKRIGDFAEAKRIEEAIVCIPFLTDNNERKFFDVDRESPEYTSQLALLDKYIFPPTFDFLTNATVDPIAFYAFEFSTDFSQDDLMNIWQNLPPASNTEFQKKTATIKIRNLVSRLLDNDKDLQWMVFKVKRRAEKDYNIFTQKGLGLGTPIVEPAIDSPYSYNWPYDYFSLVELIKIDEDVVYATEDLTSEDAIQNTTADGGT